MVHAGAASMLGLDHPMGRRFAREVYDAYSAGGATTLLQTFSDCLLPPEQEEASTA